MLNLKEASKEERAIYANRWWKTTKEKALDSIMESSQYAFICDHELMDTLIKLDSPNIKMTKFLGSIICSDDGMRFIDETMFVDGIPNVGTTTIKFTNQTSEQCLYDYYKDGQTENNDVTVLNFASFKNPGGMFLNGSPAQEESLCHHSTLYEVLRCFSSLYYSDHKKYLNNGLYMNDVLYTPFIKFFARSRFGNEENDIVNAESWKANVINCAAPNLNAYGRRFSSNDTLPSHMKAIHNALEERIETVMIVANLSRTMHLVLGAFGCGVFKNDPYDVASIFYSTILTKYVGRFKTISFPIPRGKNNNYDAFINVATRAFGNLTEVRQSDGSVRHEVTLRNPNFQATS